MLDIKVRGALEQVIDQFVSSFPTTVSSLREGIRKADLHIENENDYALGYAHGMITASFHATLLMLTNRLPNAEAPYQTPYLRVDKN